jgi:hypothetical protein
MSVTIYPIKNGRRFPTTRVERPCEACAGDYCQPGWCEDGIEVEIVSSAPECNFANANARPLLYGVIKSSRVSSILDEVEIALSCSADGLLYRAPMLRAGTRFKNYIQAASTDSSAMRRLSDVRDVLIFARAHNADVVWG